MSADNESRPWLPWWSLIEIKTRRRIIRPWQYERGSWIYTVALLTFCVSASISEMMDNDINSRIHVVGVETMSVARNMLCPQKCSGTLLTQLLVLTAASCTEYMGEIINATSSSNSNKTSPDGTGNIMSTTPLPPEKNITGFVEGDIKVYATLSLHPVLDDMNYANVSEKYVHPEWNPKTYVANLVLLKLNKRFHLMGEMPDMMNNYMLSLPDKLYFKGLGMISSKGPMINSLQSQNNVSLEIPNERSVRIVTIKFAAGTCPSSNNSQWENDTNWWSFLCTEPEFTHNFYNSTLCSADIGGPLYKPMGINSMPRLYGVFSHMYHTVFPMCASAECYIRDNAPYPCSTSNNLYYKYTALIGRYTSWLNRTVERVQMATTPTPVRKCPSTSMTQINPLETTLDPIYDIDRYSDRLRSMIANRMVCPKQQNMLKSSGRPLHRDRSLRAIGVVISALIGVHILLWRRVTF